MDYSKYYTPMHTSSALISYLKIEPPSKTIDICCGSCNLLYAAKKRWNDVELIGVDLESTENKDVKFCKMDGRRYSLKSAKKYELVLANPPFGRKDCDNYADLYKKEFSLYTTNRLENEMLIANMRILKKGGVLLAIMPSTFVEGQSNLNLRKCISQNYEVSDIIKLPINTFGNTKIRAYAVIIRKTKRKMRCNLAYMDENYLIKQTGYTEYSQMCLGDWIEVKKVSKTGSTLQIIRGTISSSCFEDEGEIILHTSVCSKSWEPSYRHIKNKVPDMKYAENGDIIVSRIGKSAGKWCRYVGERVAISDCIYVIKDSKGEVYKNIKGTDFTHLVKGVATPYIAKADIIAWYHAQYECC